MAVDHPNLGSIPPERAQGTIRKKQVGRINLLEAGRGIAALLVVIFHANASSPYFGGPQFDWMRSLEVGVDFFFVLSGYVIMYGHYDDIGNRAALGRYARNRTIRLFPSLWLIVLLTAAGQLLLFSQIDIAQFVRSMIPYPSLLETKPQVIWTLRHELLFYFAFGVLMFAKRLGLVLVAFWAMGIVAFFCSAVFGEIETSLTAFFFSTYQLNFAFGAFLYWWHRHNSSANGTLLPLVVGLLALVFWLWARGALGLGRLGLADYSSMGATLGVLITGIICAVVVHGLVRAEPVLRTPQWLMALGASSYMLYLAHSSINSVTQRIVVHAPSGFLQLGGGHLTLILVGVGISYLIHIYVEKPMIARLKKRKGVPA